MAFALRLSLALGQPLGVILDMPAEDVVLYMAWEDMYGIIGPQRSDLQNGNIVSLLFNMNKKSGTRSLYIGDAMQPQWDESKSNADKPMSADQIHAMFRGFVAK